MLAVDTNVVVRFLVRDDPVQAAASAALIGGHDVFVPTTVMLEVEWVLRGAYQMKPAAIVAAVRAFAGLPTVELEDPVLVAQACTWTLGGMDFADALHVAVANKRHCASLRTFDARFIQASKAFGTAVPVLSP